MVRNIKTLFCNKSYKRLNDSPKAKNKFVFKDQEDQNGIKISNFGTYLVDVQPVTRRHKKTHKGGKSVKKSKKMRKSIKKKSIKRRKTSKRH